MSPITEQFLIFLRAIVVGAVIMNVYDMFRILRLAFSHRDWIVFLEDICFFVLTGLITWNYLLISCRGELRAFVIVGELIGAVLWFFTAGKLVMAAAERIIEILRILVTVLLVRPVCAVLRIMLHLFRQMVRLLWWIAKRFGAEKLLFFIQKVKNTFQTAKNHLPERARLVYNFIIGFSMHFTEKPVNSEQEVEHSAESIIPSDR